MSRYLDIISVDGMDGVGKSTQVNILSNHFKRLGLKVLVNRMTDDLNSSLDNIANIWKFLEENSDGIVINDGSIATMIQLEYQSGKPHAAISERYKDIIHENEKLNHKYGMANILLVMDNLKVCDERLKKRRRLMGDENPIGIDNIERERVLVEGLKNFDNYTISKSIRFHTLITHEHDSILDVHDDILKTIKGDFEIKKPSNEG